MPVPRLKACTRSAATIALAQAFSFELEAGKRPDPRVDSAHDRCDGRRLGPHQQAHGYAVLR
jgi:hypothetical protein